MVLFFCYYCLALILFRRSKQDEIYLYFISPLKGTFKVILFFYNHDYTMRIILYYSATSFY